MDRVVIYYITVTRDLLKLHKFVTLVENVMFMNGTQLFITMSNGIKFVTVQHVVTHTAKQVSKYLKGL